MRNLFFLIAAFLLTATAANAQCKWVDGQDPSFSSDPGRGVTSWDLHFVYAKMAVDFTDSYTFVGARLETLKSCVPVTRFARVYADVSIKIAEFGIKFAGWRNSLNNSLANDGGCGYLDWTAHYDYVKQNGAGTTPQLVKNRLAILSKKAPKEEYAKLYATVSVIIARAGVGYKGCDWFDGQDSKLGSDPGRGVTSWQIHFDFGKSASNLTDSYTFVGERLVSLKTCLDKEAFAALYADLSVKIAEYGIKFAGWKNNLNNPVPNDGGCGYLVWKGHFDYVDKNGPKTVDQLVKNRLVLLSSKLSKDDYGKLYADVSVIIALYGQGK
jgi:hypothetical protein